MAAKEILLYGSSQSRDMTLYPSGNSYTIFLSSPVKNIERVDLVSARVPNSMYNLTNGTGALAVGSITVSLNAGFYGVYDMATALTNTGLVTCTYLTFEGKFIFSSASAFGVKVNSAELSNIIGIPVTTTAIAATQVAASGSTWPTYANQYILTSNVVVNASVGEQIFLDIDELKTPRHIFTGGLQYVQMQSGSDKYVTQLTAGDGPSRAFAPITLDVNSGFIKNFHENKDYRISVFYPEPINSLQRLTVRWVDIHGQPLIFNGLEQNSFILRLHVRAKVMEPTEEENELERRVAELEIKRFIEDVENKADPPPPPQKTRFGRWTVVLLALLGILGYVVYKRFIVPNPVGEFGPVGV